MRHAEIRLSIELDEQNVPDKIFWSATDSPTGGLEETKAINLSIWDHRRKETMRIDLWAKDLPVDEMKRCIADTIMGMAETVRTATDDEVMAAYMEELARKLFRHIKEMHSAK
ncbi:MAG: gliding motility protein GldC [Cytophagales bacterium]|nr:gliding motility protein GldC [Bernardetiaceae bacterium]MDW8203404.1 gliding motility protein GldC [Cytophagales bacterium]